MNELPSDIFVRRLKAERERQRLSQPELSRRVAQFIDVVLDPSTITRIEQGSRAVRLDEAVAFAQALKVPLTWLLQHPEVDQRDGMLEEYHARLAAALVDFERARADIARYTDYIHALTLEKTGHGSTTGFKPDPDHLLE